MSRVRPLRTRRPSSGERDLHLPQVVLRSVTPPDARQSTATRTSSSTTTSPTTTPTVSSSAASRAIDYGPGTHILTNPCTSDGTGEGYGTMNPSYGSMDPAYESMGLGYGSMNYEYGPMDHYETLECGNNQPMGQGLGIMNPLSDDGGGSPLPSGLPSPLRPTIPVSQSLPTFSRPFVDLLLTPDDVTSDIFCSNVVSPVSNISKTPSAPRQQLTPPPNTPLSPPSSSTSSSAQPSTPRLRKSPQESITKGNVGESFNLLSPTSNPTPPNTPLSPPIVTPTTSSQGTDTASQKVEMSRGNFETPDQKVETSSQNFESQEINDFDLINHNDQNIPGNSSSGSYAGPLENILSPNTVDLTNLRPFPKEINEVLPFPYLPSSYSVETGIIKSLIDLGKGFYDENEATTTVDNRYQGRKSRSLHECQSKNPDLKKLEEQENIVAACWNHNLNAQDENKKTTQLGIKTSRPQDEANWNKKKEEKMQKKGSKKKKGKGDETAKTKNKKEKKDRSLYSELKVPMIDDVDDVDYGGGDDDDNDDHNDDESDSYKTDFSKQSTYGSSTSSTSSSDDSLGDQASKLAEQLCDVTTEAGRFITEEMKEGIDYLTEPEDTLEFGWLDALTGVVSIGTFYFDLVSDALVAYYMYDDPDSMYWFLATLLLLLLPLALANGFSLYWYWFDERVCEPEMCYRHPRVPNYVWAFRVVSHLLLQASVTRQIDILYYGTKSTSETPLRAALVDEVMEAALMAQPEDNTSKPEQIGKGGRASLRPCPGDSGRNSPSAPQSRSMSACSRRTGNVCCRGGYVALWIHAERDAASVDLLLSLIQDAPLLILHLYIMAHTLPAQALEGRISQTLIMQMLSVTASLLTLAWSVASCVRATRLTEPSLPNLSILDLLLLTLAHFCSIAAQVMSFSLFASKLLLAFSATVIFHWLLMSSWVLTQLLCFPRTTCTRAAFAHDRQEGWCHQLDDVLFSGAMGIVLLFTWIDVGGNSPRAQCLIYHVVLLLEDLILLTVWFVWVEGSAWYHWLPLMLVPVFFCLNLLFDALFHVSSRPMKCVPLATAPKAV